MSNHPPDPENRAGAPDQECARSSAETDDKVLAFRKEVKRTILTALAGKVVTGSDFEARRTYSLSYFIEAVSNYRRFNIHTGKS